MELPSCFLGEFVIKTIGRRWSHVLCMVCSAVPYLLIVIIFSEDESIGSAVKALALIARFSSNIGWYIMWVQAMEIIPTNVRGTGCNIAGMIAAIAVIGCPQLVAFVSLKMKAKGCKSISNFLQGKTHPREMYGTFVALGVLGALATSLLPETLKQPLPQCVEDTEKTIRHPFFSWRVWKNTSQSQLELHS